MKTPLRGVVTVKDLLMNDYAALMGDIMDPHVIKAYTTEDQERSWRRSMSTTS